MFPGDSEGIIKTKGEGVDHVVSVVGWGTDSKDRGSDYLEDLAEFWFWRCDKYSFRLLKVWRWRILVEVQTFINFLPCNDALGPTRMACTGSCATLGANTGERWDTSGGWDYGM